MVELQNAGVTPVMDYDSALKHLIQCLRTCA